MCVWVLQVMFQKGRNGPGPSWDRGREVTNNRKYLGTPMFTAALFTIMLRWKQPKCLSMDEWINKMWSFHNTGILLSPKKEGDSDTCYNMDEPWGHYPQWNKSDTKAQILYDSTHVRSLNESHLQRQEVDGGCQGLGEGDEESAFNGDRVSVWEDEKVLEMDGGDGCTTGWMYLVPLNCALKMVKMIKLLHSKGNHKQNKKTTYELGENICKWCDW